MLSRFLYFPGTRLSTAELTAACLDGHLVGLGEGYVPADLVESAALRAASLAPLLRENFAATHESAAWVLGIVPEPPDRHHVHRAVHRRIPPIFDRRVVCHDSRIPSEDLLSIGGVHVSRPARTLADLARGESARSALVAHEWARSDSDTCEAALRWLETHRGVPHKSRAQRMLHAALESVPSLRTT